MVNVARQIFASTATTAGQRASTRDAAAPAVRGVAARVDTRTAAARFPRLAGVTARATVRGLGLQIDAYAAAAAGAALASVAWAAAASGGHAHAGAARLSLSTGVIAAAAVSGIGL